MIRRLHPLGTEHSAGCTQGLSATRTRAVAIHSPLSRGCHALIRQGAKLVETANDILEELGALARVATGRAQSPADLPPVLAGLLGQLGHDPVSVDQLVERSGLTPEAVSSMLLELELQGLVGAGAGGKYQRIF